MIVKEEKTLRPGPNGNGSVGYASFLDRRADRSLEQFRGQWWVLHTKPRNEKAIAAILHRLDIVCFLPLAQHRRTCRGRVRLVNLPLFPGYVFLCGDWKAREAALKTNRVVKVLDVGDQERLKTDLVQIENVLRSGEPVDLYPGLRVGARCRVKSGAFAGLEGIVLRRRGLWRVYVAVHFIAQSAELELDSVMVEVMD